MSRRVSRPSKSIAALTARQYREAKKRELAELREMVRKLSLEAAFYRNNYESALKEIDDLRNMLSHKESSSNYREVLEQITVPHVNLLDERLAFTDSYIENDQDFSISENFPQSVSPLLSNYELGFETESDQMDPISKAFRL